MAGKDLCRNHVTDRNEERNRSRLARLTQPSRVFPTLTRLNLLCGGYLVGYWFLN